MKESAQTIHKTHRDQNRHFNFLLLLLPSIAFVLVLALFLRNRYTPTNIAVETEQKKQEVSDIVVKDVSVHVRVAKTESEREHGLSGTESMSENEGMLFVFGSKAQPAFWMKDMLLPLDFIWIADGKIVQIDKNVPAPEFGTPDNKLKLYIPRDPITHVLEVKAGFVDSHKIAVGDHVTIP